MEKIKWGEFPDFLGPRDYFKNTLIIKKVKNFVGNEGKILDFGCGCGNLSIRLANLNFLVFSYDISSLCLKILKEKIIKKSLKIKIIENISEFDKMNEYFDCICCGEVLEHIQNENEVLQLFWRILKKNGVCIITVPARMKYWDVGDVLGGHFRRYEKNEIIELFQKSGFVVKIFYCLGPLNFLWYKFIFIPFLRVMLTKRKKNKKGFFDYFLKLEFVKKTLSYIFYFDLIFSKFNIWNSYLIVIQKK